MTPGQEANGANLEIFFFDLLDNNGMLSVMSTHNIKCHDKLRKFPKYLFS